MTATDELRRMLDERGVEHEGSERSLRWRDRNGVMMQAFPLADGELGMEVWSCTPEQAIAATLGSCNCSNSERTGTCLPYFWTHDGVLHIELPKLPGSIQVRLPDERDREVRSARTWQYTLGDADLAAENAKLRELVLDYERCTMHADCSRCEYDGKLSTHCPLSPCFPDADELRELGVEVDA